MSKPNLPPDFERLVHTATFSPHEREKITEVHYEECEPRPLSEESAEEIYPRPARHKRSGPTLFSWTTGLLVFAGYMTVAGSWPSPVVSFVGGGWVSALILCGAGVLTMFFFYVLFLKLCPNRYSDGSWETPQNKEYLQGLRKQAGNNLVRPRWTHRTYVLNRYRISALAGSLAVVALGVAQVLLGYYEGRIVEETRTMLGFFVPLALLGAVVTIISGLMLRVARVMFRGEA